MPGIFTIKLVVFPEITIINLCEFLGNYTSNPRVSHYGTIKR